MPKRPKKSEAPAPAVEAPAEVAAPVAVPVEEQRVQAPEAEVLSLAVAEEAGVLPDEDRRAPEPVVETPVVESAPLIPNDQIHVIQEREDGTKVTALGSILE